MPDPLADPVAAALVDFGNGLSRLPPGELPDLIDRTGVRMGATAVTAYVVDLAQDELRPLHGDGQSLRVDGTMAGRAFRTEAVVEQADDARLLLWVPLLDSSERLGVLAVRLRSDHQPGEGDLRLWAAFGSLVGESIVGKSAYGDQINAVRGMKDTTLAAELRWAQLPPLTYTSDRVSVSGILEPAYEIAGDTFDYAVGDEALSAAILDAMGHGLEASRMANLAVGAYRHARRRQRDIDDILLDIDEIVGREFGDQRFVTGQLAALDLRSGRLRIVNAGHPRPLLFRGARHVGHVECRPRPPLGLGPVETTVSEVSLEPEDSVVLYTDGVIEARSRSGEEFGVDRLADLIARALRGGVRSAEVMRAVVHAVYDHTGPLLSDDASLVMLRWHGDPRSGPSVR